MVMSSLRILTLLKKKPLYHFLPGSTSFSIATVGCNLKCSFCQNWQISQVSKSGTSGVGQEVSPERVVEEAVANGCSSISYTYTEPTIFLEFALDVARAAKNEGLRNVFVTNGYMSKEAVDLISPYLDACNIDLKSFREEFYVSLCNGHVQPVLDTIAYMKKRGIWIEVTTLIIPGQNDSVEELTDIAEFIATVGKEIPWHISRYRPEYKYDLSPPTSLAILRKAKEIGLQAGLKYVYMGNVIEGNDTICYQCGETLIERYNFTISNSRISEKKCNSCGSPIDGIM